jgi:AcrR family transcriptional regulator
MTPDGGLRERKKAQTRQLIAETAWQLFADRGFDRVTVADVARRAQVAEKTVFNYFPTKHDLLFSRLDAFGAHLVAAIDERRPGEPVFAAFRRFLLEQRGLLAEVAEDAHARDRLRTVNRVIAESPVLRSRELQAIASCAEALAARIAAETGADRSDPRPRVAAHALLGVHRALIDLVRERALADDRVGQLAADVREAGEAAFALLEPAIGTYAPKPPTIGPRD